jgi:hypothetical protein
MKKIDEHTYEFEEEDHRLAERFYLERGGERYLIVDPPYAVRPGGEDCGETARLNGSSPPLDLVAELARPLYNTIAANFESLRQELDDPVWRELFGEDRGGVSWGSPRSGPGYNQHQHMEGAMPVGLGKSIFGEVERPRQHEDGRSQRRKEIDRKRRKKRLTSNQRRHERRRKGGR